MERKYQKSQITTAINKINGLQNYYYLISDSLDEDVVNDSIINWNSFRKNYSANDEYVIFVTEKAFDDNWFSHEERQFSIITTHDWEEHFSPPSLKAYLMYQIAQSLINFPIQLNENMEMRMVHNPAKGCIFDLCIDKTDIHLGMIAGNICPSCRANLVRYGSDEKAICSIERIVDYVRAEAIGKPIRFDENSAFIVMRFSQNDDNNNAYLYGIQPALNAMRIKCIRADNQILSGPLLKKIEENIKSSRFVIVKVDSDNLNVYFELGLALGMNKDVLLISEKNLILNLPTDLKNWECLTYSYGDFGELKHNIIKYFTTKYYYKAEIHE